MVQLRTLVCLLALELILVCAIDLNIANVDSIKSAASNIASGMVAHYEDNEIHRSRHFPFSWWESGAMFDTLLHYWRLTGDDQYNGLVAQGLLAQQGPNGDYKPSGQMQSESNNGQSAWALAAMSAAESTIAEPQNTTWFALAQTVFDDQVARWDMQSCSGGLRWGVYIFNNGYNYKNSIANGNLFQLASRLARHTGNKTYTDWAVKVFDWTVSVGFIDQDWNVFEGARTTTNCSDIHKVQISYYAGTLIAGAAHMYNMTTGDSQTKWKGALDGLLNRTLTVFFPEGVATEISCGSMVRCRVSKRAFKGVLGRSLVDTMQAAPYTSQIIRPLLISSAQAAAKACDDTGCAFDWNGPEPENDRGNGVGEYLSALNFVQGLLVADSAPPITEQAEEI